MHFPPCGGHGQAGAEGGMAASALLSAEINWTKEFDCVKFNCLISLFFQLFMIVNKIDILQKNYIHDGGL